MAESTEKTKETGVLAPSPTTTKEGQMSSYIRPQARKLHDPDVTLEEYLYYAQKTREIEKSYESPKLRWRQILRRNKEANDGIAESTAEVNGDGKDFQNDVNYSSPDARLQISDEEWINASRAFRTASSASCFFLITTDILGPYGVGFSLGTLGWGPGIALYTVFGFLAGYSGYLVWRVYLGVDSYQFPCRNYGDLAYRSLGTVGRHVTNILQAVALLLVLGQVTLQYGQNISQVSKFRLCYAVCPLLFTIVGLVLTQIRTLKAYGLVANFAVYLNLLVIFMTMGFISASPPNYAISVLGSAGGAVDPSTITPDAHGNYPAIFHYSKLPPGSLVGSVNGLLSGVLAYAGVQLFVEFMAEMRRPLDFIKAMWGAQFFIYTVYMAYGCFVYYYQGQYSYNPSYQGVSVYGWQAAGNILTLISALIAAGLYGNIGVKVLYNNVLMDLFKAPPLTTKKGKILYAAIVPIWWAIAFVIAAAIPDFFGFVSLMSASTLINLCYSLPPLYALGFAVKKNAIQFDRGEGFNPETGEVKRVDTGFRRLMRGFLAGGPLQIGINVWHVLYFLASLSMCGLGMYAAVEGMIEAFQTQQLSAFSCRSPLNLNA
ncbi:amino acid transporter [Lecanosticta acicola]|uniref:Amino acid transporter n=1 Tax=Lecanosticta acicola TaxID=111012 RepID=A0AAI8Z9S0_9PEZI|nr:amino acid transporter [Lecanosticta acicola]